MDQKGLQKFTLNEWENENSKKKIEFLTNTYVEANKYIKSNNELVEIARNLSNKMENYLCDNDDLKYSFKGNSKFFKH